MVRRSSDVAPCTHSICNRYLAHPLVSGLIYICSAQQFGEPWDFSKARPTEAGFCFSLAKIRSRFVYC
jgi:hypothetical protein